jgi:hypothetical protein
VPAVLSGRLFSVASAQVCGGRHADGVRQPVRQPLPPGAPTGVRHPPRRHRPCRPGMQSEHHIHCAAIALVALVLRSQGASCLACFVVSPAADLLAPRLRRRDGDRVASLAMQAAPLFTTLMQRAMELIQGCGCLPDTGCPGCVQHTDCGEYNAVISKVSFSLHLGCSCRRCSRLRVPRSQEILRTCAKGMLRSTCPL